MVNSSCSFGALVVNFTKILVHSQHICDALLMQCHCNMGPIVTQRPARSYIFPGNSGFGRQRCASCLKPRSQTHD
eukprot:3175994-Pleurochrysis_carterae.AAC.1